MIAVDSNMLLMFLTPFPRPPFDKLTGEPITSPKERFLGLIEEIERKKRKILVPTPVLSECLVHAGTARIAYVEVLQRHGVFRIAPFDSRAAIELAIMTEVALKSGDKKGGVEAPWAKIKLDRQIVAIAKVEGADTVYSDDAGVKIFAEANGLRALGLRDCPVPDGGPQPRFL